ALLALPHRRRRNPFDAPGLDEDKLDRTLDEAGDQGQDDDNDDDPGPGPDGDGGGGGGVPPQADGEDRTPPRADGGSDDAPSG
ncbi:magnesium chelatase, partial [Streptomyces griseus]|nr:magnesium chelatase [Streptomyces griseus]